MSLQTRACSLCSSCQSHRPGIQRYVHLPSRKILPWSPETRLQATRTPSLWHPISIASSSGLFQQPLRWHGPQVSSKRCLQQEATARAAPVSAPLPLEGSRLILVDAMAIIYRSHFGFKGDMRLSTAKGLDTTIIYAFVKTILGLLEMQPPPTHLAVVFDAHGKTFRHEMFKDYKMQRPEMPEEIGAALGPLRALLAELSVPVVMAPGVEADDVIGSLAERATAAGMTVSIASPDKDFFQLLRPGVELLRDRPKDSEKTLIAGRLSVYTHEDFEAEKGIKPSQWVDALALGGDASDNIPGVKGIGIVGALKLVKEFGSIEEMIEKADQITKKVQREALQSEVGSNAAVFSKKMITIHRDVSLPPLRFPLEDLQLRLPPDGGAAALATCETLEFKTLARALPRIWKTLFG